MTVQAALPSSVKQGNASILTCVVPAPNGCNLRCPFCFIKQRGEATASTMLSPSDYARFINEVGHARHVSAICIQGYEPLLPEAFVYTRAILVAGRLLNIPTSLVSNGTFLQQWVDELRTLEPSRISISLDAAQADNHDRQRRKRGAFAGAIEGLKAAVSDLAESTELVVTSVLVPKRREQLDEMPQLLKEIGIKRWIVTVLQRIGADSISRPIGQREELLADLRLLNGIARTAGVDFLVDDEFAALGNQSDVDGPVHIRRLLNPGGVYRLIPDGRCSKGAAILRPVHSESPRWNPNKNAAMFLQSL